MIYVSNPSLTSMYVKLYSVWSVSTIPVFNVRDTILSVIVQIIINLLTKERGSLACVLQNTLHWILLKGYHVSDHQHIPKRGQLFSYLSWGIGEMCILFDLIYIFYLPGISYYPKDVGIYNPRLITIIHSHLLL